MNYIKTLHDQVDGMLKQFVQSLPSIAIAAIIVVLTWFVARFAVHIAERATRGTHMRENLKQLVETTTRLFIWLVGLMIAATVALPGVTPASVFAGLGVSALAIGFAFQDIFQNFLAGVLIMLRDKMRIGDSIECQGISGKVERITLRETHVRAPSNELTIVPNSTLFKNPVKITTDKPQRRFQMIVSVMSNYDLDEAAEAIRAAMKTIEDIDQTHAIDVFAREFKAGSVDFLVRWWSPSRANDFILQDRVIRQVKKALDEAKIAIAGAQPAEIIEKAFPTEEEAEAARETEPA